MYREGDWNNNEIKKQKNTYSARTLYPNLYKNQNIYIIWNIYKNWNI